MAPLPHTNYIIIYYNFLLCDGYNKIEFSNNIKKDVHLK